MPELPEVETTVRGLRRNLLGRSIVGVYNNWPRHIVNVSVEELRDRISGAKIDSIHRRGKYLIFTLSSNESLVIHLKMSGSLAFVDQVEPTDPYAHTVFNVGGKHELRFHDVRKFGRVYLVQQSSEIVGDLGPEPLDESFSPELFYTMLHGKKRLLKPLLLDQTFIAGIGNIYADEALHWAEIDPRRQSDTLSKLESDTLHMGIRHVLNLAIERNGSSISSYRKPDGDPGNMQDSLKVYGQAGMPCPRCGNKIERIKLGSRSTHFCPACQK